MSQRAEFWFDPICPWTWLTFRWMREVQRVRDIEVDWHLMSLTLLNQPADADDADLGRGDTKLQIVRVFAAAEQLRGPAILEPLFMALGRRIHTERRPIHHDSLEPLVESLAELDLPPDLIEAATSPHLDGTIRAWHDQAVAHSGPDVGSPVIAVTDGAFFGPVVSPFPTGQEAAELWDAFLTLVRHREFYELKRGRIDPPDFSADNPDSTPQDTEPDDDAPPLICPLPGRG